MQVWGETLSSKEVQKGEEESNEVGCARENSRMDGGEAEVGRQRRIKWRGAHDGLAGLQRLPAAIQLLVKATLKSLLAVPTIQRGNERKKRRKWNMEREDAGKCCAPRKRQQIRKTWTPHLRCYQIINPFNVAAVINSSGSAGKTSNCGDKM